MMPRSPRIKFNMYMPSMMPLQVDILNVCFVVLQECGKSEEFATRQSSVSKAMFRDNSAVQVLSLSCIVEFLQNSKY